MKILKKFYNFVRNSLNFREIKFWIELQGAMLTDSHFKDSSHKLHK